MVELRVVLTIAALVVAMVLAGVIALRQRIGVAVLALLSFVWLTLDKEFEGGVLLSFDKTHGLATADLVGIAGLLACVVFWVRLRRRRGLSGHRT